MTTSEGSDSDRVIELPPAACLVGIDWVSEEHAVHVEDPSGRRLSVFTIAHSRDGFEKLIKRLAETARPTRCR